MCFVLQVSRVKLKVKLDLFFQTPEILSPYNLNPKQKPWLTVENQFKKEH